MEGHRVRFHDGHMGTVKNAASFGAGGEIPGYGVDVTPDGRETIFLTRGDAESGDRAFTILPERVPEEECAALPERGHKP